MIQTLFFIGDIMACCGGGKKVIRVQQTPQQAAQAQRVNLKPPSTMRVFVNNQKTNTQEAVVVQRAAPSVIKKTELQKCTVCGHPAMIQMVGGRSRLQCTNFSCRAII